MTGYHQHVSANCSRYMYSQPKLATRWSVCGRAHAVAWLLQSEQYVSAVSRRYDDHVAIDLRTDPHDRKLETGTDINLSIDEWTKGFMRMRTFFRSSQGLNRLNGGFDDQPLEAP